MSPAYYSIPAAVILYETFLDSSGPPPWHSMRTVMFGASEKPRVGANFCFKRENILTQVWCVRTMTLYTAKRHKSTQAELLTDCSK